MAAQDKIEVTRQQIKEVLRFSISDEIKSMEELCEKLKNWNNPEKNIYLSRLLKNIGIQQRDVREYQAEINL